MFRVGVGTVSVVFWNGFRNVISRIFGCVFSFFRGFGEGFRDGGWKAEVLSRSGS